MKVKSFIKVFLIIVVVSLLLFTAKMVHVYNSCKTERANRTDYSWSMTQRPFYSTSSSVDLIVSNKDVNFRIWAEGLTGKVDISISDINNNIVFNKDFKNFEDNLTLALEPGKYSLNIDVANYTGAVYFGFNNVTALAKLPEGNFEFVSGDEDKGFKWEYILYTPKNITNNYLLVVPNNSGLVDEDIEVHKQRAVQLINRKAQTADKLQVPLLVPVFPRATEDDVMYTHALDRNTILAPKEDRLDLQLISMIKDSKKRLQLKGVKLDSQVLLSGFSASGDFVDRFSFLHPELVKAVSLGGCDNMIPYSQLNGENLPYPIGIFDYKDITGKDFNKQEFADVKRLIYKGSKDEGGWITTSSKSEESVTYTGLEYYEKFLVPKIEAFSAKSWVPLYINGELDNIQKSVIIYRVFDKKILLDKFNIVSELFNDKGLDNHQFKVYDGVQHEVTSEMNNDEIEFFRSVLKEVN